MPKVDKKEVTWAFSSLYELFPDYHSGNYDFSLMTKRCQETFGIAPYDMYPPEDFFDGTRSIDDQIKILSAIQKAAVQLGWEKAAIEYEKDYDYDNYATYEFKIRVSRMETDEECALRVEETQRKSRLAKASAKVRKQNQEKAQEERERKLLAELQEKYGQ